MNQPNSVCSVIFSPRVIANMDSVDIVMEFVLHGISVLLSATMRLSVGSLTMSLLPDC
jgi:hypothetical protein